MLFPLPSINGAFVLLLDYKNMFVKHRSELGDFPLVFRQSTYSKTILCHLGPAKVNKVKFFSGPYYMLKRVLTFVSGVQESVLVDFTS